MAIAKHKTRVRELREGRALARRVQRGDRQAFELLYASYEGRLYRFCHRLTGSDAAAASLVEATFVRALATLPEEGLDALDIPAHLAATARILAYERRTNGGLGWLDPIAGEHAREVGAANQRLSPRQRMTLALRDLEGRSDDEIALALGANAAAVATLVARARMRLRGELELPSPADGCRDRLPTLSAYVDGTLPADRRAALETHVAGCAGCRAAQFALEEAALRYRSLPVPVPPGELRSRITVALGAVGFPTRRPRALVPDPAPGAGGRPMAAAAAMAALVVVGAGVTIIASGDGPKRDESTRAPAPSSAVSRSANAALHSVVPAPATATATTRAGATVPRRAPPVVRHLRAGPPLPARAAAAAARTTASSPATTRPRSSGAPAAAPPPAAPAAPPEPAPPPTPLAAPPARPEKVRVIPVEILPPVAPPHVPATADAPPPPPAPPPPADPAAAAQTTST
jgi:DNA-directed RNA polymerase specialized sigma24 family protein